LIERSSYGFRELVLNVTGGMRMTVADLRLTVETTFLLTT